MSLWEIPTNWKWAKTAEIALIVGGGTPPTKNPLNFADNGIPWITPADLSGYQDEYISRGKRDLSEAGFRGSGAQLLPKDSVLFTSRAPIGYCALAANEISTNQGFKSFVLKGGINPKYIRHYLLSSKNYAESLASGSTFKELSGHRMASLEIPIPPLNEQKRIVARIEELQARSRHAREALGGIPDLLNQLRHSILAAAFRGDLTRDWREQHPHTEPATELLKRILSERRSYWEKMEYEKLRTSGNAEDKIELVFSQNCNKYKEPTAPNTRNLLNLPHNWTWANWGQLSNWITYGFTRPMPHVNDGPVIATAKNVAASRIDFISAARTTLKAFEALSEKDKPIPGDILITKDGTIGRAAIIPQEVDAFCINQSVAVIWLRSCPVDQSYLLRLIESPWTQERIKDQAKGMALQHLSITDFAKMPLQLPPIEEQKEIVKIVEKYLVGIDRIYASIKILADFFWQFEHTVLTKAFRGELVPQDPNDEPAAALLDRIRTEKQFVKSNLKKR